jgi:hypothetical protein
MFNIVNTKDRPIALCNLNGENEFNNLGTRKASKNTNKRVTIKMINISNKERMSLFMIRY